MVGRSVLACGVVCVGAAAKVLLEWHAYGHLSSCSDARIQFLPVWHGTRAGMHGYELFLFEKPQ